MLLVTNNMKDNRAIIFSGPDGLQEDDYLTELGFKNPF